MKRWKKKARAIGNARYYRKVFAGMLFGRPAYIVPTRKMGLSTISLKAIRRMRERMA